MPTTRPGPLATLHRYNCAACRHDFQTTEEYDASCKCDECGREAELVESIPLYPADPVRPKLLAALLELIDVMDASPGSWPSSLARPYAMARLALAEAESK